ncbi:MarR family winged helix-turn-helix transcriptional regulator [Marinicella sp. W31]|uniref:MarR family winged helix-turn-helix transcriptional regulator n=1 Tax=Marinicella sp. W31 TaxID=3023713 RepID=UPI003758161A
MSKASQLWGEFSLGSRLRLISEQLYGDVDRFYTEQKIPFKTRFYPVFHLLSTQGSQTIKSLSQQAGFSHSAMSQTIKAMSELDYVALSSGEDARQRIVQLTATGEALLKTLQPFWQSIEQVKEDILAECDVHFMQALQQFESALEKMSFYQRLQNNNERRS